MFSARAAEVVGFAGVLQQITSETCRMPRGYALHDVMISSYEYIIIPAISNVQLFECSGDRKKIQGEI